VNGYHLRGVKNGKRIGKMYVIAPSVAPEIEKALAMSKARNGVWAKLET